MAKPKELINHPVVRSLLTFLLLHLLLITVSSYFLERPLFAAIIAAIVTIVLFYPPSNKWIMQHKLLTLLIVSAGFNVVVIGMLIIFKTTSNLDFAVVSAGIDKSCNHDYNELLASIDSNNRLTDKELDKKLFASSVCFTAYPSKKLIDMNSIKPLAGSADIH